MDGRYYPYDHGGPYLVSWFIFAVLVALLAIAVYYAVMRLGRGGAHAAPAAALRAPADDALSVLRLRYARGEITREEYLQATEDLSGVPPPGAPSGGTTPPGA